MRLYLIILLLALSSCSDNITDITYTSGDIKITVETGENWLHEYPLFLGLTKDNPPQFAIWLEDTSGKYLSTIFCTYKIATEGWVSNNGNRRKEALPHWCHQRGVVYSDGLYLPTKDIPLTDGITGATPKTNKEIKAHLNDFLDSVVVKAEFNHSIDFNSYFPENAKEGQSNYSGGDEGSGQPAVIYRKKISPNSGTVIMDLIGRSSSDGNDGEIYTNLENLTTAKSIIKQIKIEVIK